MDGINIIDNTIEDPCTNMMPNIFKICQPISNLEDLTSVLHEPPSWVNRVKPLVPRSSTVVKNDISDCHTESRHYFPTNRFDVRTVPKTLVCHDYKGGYLADRYIHETGENILGNGYTFYNWAQIDIFVYFSHHFITIPPLCWINAGHSRGVKVLGTLITEFDEGNKICDQNIFKNTCAMREFAKTLAQLTKIFGFDGWLLNIENKVENVDVLKKFVPFFTTLIHDINPGNLVIWYDSVTVNGELKWQNELNNHNSYFFDSCDGIFLNYTWNENNLQNSVQKAQHRLHDVFVGIDVFGRNMYGGGKFHTYKAMELVTRNKLSVALFATGWTLESLEKSENIFEQFLNKDSAFWTILWPYLYTHPINNYFTTNFYIGLDKRHYNIFSQQIHLSKFLYPTTVTNVPDREFISLLNTKCNCIRTAIVGSQNTCLLTKENMRTDIEYVIRLFICDIEIVDNTVVYFLTKCTDVYRAQLSLTLLVAGYNGNNKKIKLLPESKSILLNNESVQEVNPCEAVDVIDNIRVRYHKMIEEQWKLSVYIFETKLSYVMEIGGTIENGNSLYFGAFGIESADGNFLKNL